MESQMMVGRVLRCVKEDVCFSTKVDKLSLLFIFT